MQNGITLAFTMIFILFLGSIFLTVAIGVYITPLTQTPRDVVKEIVSLMKLTSKDSLADLGCGDGNILMEAYRQSKCKCFGYDLSPIMVMLAKLKVLE